MTRTLFIHEGRFAAEVPYEEIDDGSPFGPHVRQEDTYRLDRVRLALQRGEVSAAAKEAKVFELLPLAGERKLRQRRRTWRARGVVLRRSTCAGEWKWGKKEAVE